MLLSRLVQIKMFLTKSLPGTPFIKANICSGLLYDAIQLYIYIYFFLRDFIFKKTLFEKVQYLKQELYYYIVLTGLHILGYSHGAKGWKQQSLRL